MVVHFFSVNFFSIPLTQHIEKYFSEKQGVDKIFICHNVLNDHLMRYSSKSEIIPIFTYDFYKDFIRDNEGILFKLKKYLKLFFILLKFSISSKKIIWYTIDYQIIPLIYIVSFFKKSKCFIAYHEFELVQKETLNQFNRFFFNLYKRLSAKIDLVIVPEANRLEYLLKTTNVRKENTLLFPNTCFSNRDLIFRPHELLETIGKNTFLVGHTGNLGPSCFLKSILEVISGFKNADNITLLFIGSYTKEVKEIIAQYKLENLILIDRIKHAELNSIYQRINLGLILYKPVDLNYEFCAPNKLYEYWSFGIPVIAHKLKGLLPLFHNDAQGQLIDMENVNEFKDIISGYIHKHNSGNDYKSAIMDIFEKKYEIKRYFEKLNQRMPFLQ